MLKVPYIDRIWTTRGHVELDPPLGPAETFARLDPLLTAAGTEYRIDGDTLEYSKENPAAQDRLATFTKGTLQVVEDHRGARLNYRLTSPALLMVFLAPLLFLAFAQATIVIVELERPTAEEKAEAERKKKEKEKEAEEPKPLNVVDQMLGAPAPETLEEKKQREKAEKKDEDARHSPRPAFVFAGMFAALYLFGRWFEPFLIRRRFRKAIDGTLEVEMGESDQPEAKPG